MTTYGAHELPTITDGDRVPLDLVEARLAFLRTQLSRKNACLADARRQSDASTVRELMEYFDELADRVQHLCAITSQSDIAAYKAYVKKFT